MQNDSVFTKVGVDGIRRPSTGIKVLLFMLPWMFVVLGLLLAFVSYTYVSNAEQTTATVVSFAELLDGQTPVLSYSYEDNAYATPLGTVTQVENFPVGSEINILLDPGVPENIRLTGLAYSYGFAALIAVVGLALLMVSQIIWIILRRRVARIS